MMTTIKEQFKNDLQKDPADLAREADGARENLEGTVDKLMHQLSPKELIDRGIAMVRNTGDLDFVRNVINRVETNPIPTALAGVGLIWLMTASSSPTPPSHALAERTREAGHKVAEGTRSGLREASNGYSELLNEQPFLIGALALAAGAALGALLPRTSVEDRAMGEWSDKGADAIKDKAEEKLQDLQGKPSTDGANFNDAAAYDTPPPPASPGAGGAPDNTYHGTI
jgi:ElaB/YqjD/DUF883 family membrane-anchored ribosome-binding protein